MKGYAILAVVDASNPQSAVGIMGCPQHSDTDRGEDRADQRETQHATKSRRGTEKSEFRVHVTGPGHGNLLRASPFPALLGTACTHPPSNRRVISPKGSKLTPS